MQKLWLPTNFAETILSKHLNIHKREEIVARKISQLSQHFLSAKISSFNIVLFRPANTWILNLACKFYVVLIRNLATLNVRNFLLQNCEKYLNFHIAVAVLLKKVNFLIN